MSKDKSNNLETLANLRINTDDWKRFKLLCIINDTTASHELRIFVKSYLAADTKSCINSCSDYVALFGIKNTCKDIKK